MILPVTLTIAGAAALLNIWHMMRTGRVRHAEQVSVGDGGNDNLIRKMRAHANLGESLPVVLVLLGAIELASGTSIWLWIIGGVYILGRVAHAFGMDGGKLEIGRMIGTLTAMLAMLILAIWAISIPYFAIDKITIEEEIVAEPLG